MAKSSPQAAKPKKYREQAERLEAVRDQIWFRTLKELREDLRDRGFKVSYQTLSNWHRGDREPTTAYYAALNEHYGASLRFLLRGQGPVFEEDLDLEALGARFPEGAVWGMKYAPQGLAQLSFLNGALLLSLSDPLAYMESPESDEEEAALLNLIVQWANAPLEALGVEDAPQGQLTTYYTTLFSAVQGFVPPKGQGKPIKEIITRWEKTWTGGEGENHG